MININFPLNSVSFGNVSQGVLRELYKRDEKICLFPIGQPDLSSYNIEQEFGNYLNQSIQRGFSKYKRINPTIKLWHISGSHEFIGDKKSLISFHECDSCTEQEINLISNLDQVFFTSQYTKKVFEDYGAENISYLPLGIDTHHFYEKLDTPYLPNDVITWLILGKMEERKQTLRSIKLWSDKFGNNRNHQLLVLCQNPFIEIKQQENAIAQTLGGKQFFNIVFLPHLKTAAEVSDTINACDIFISLSRLEGFDVPLATAMYLGKSCVVLNEHVHRDYCFDNNSILVNSSGKIPAIDNIFFHANSPFNCGNWYDCTSEAIIDGFERGAKSIEIVNNKKQSIYYSEAKKIIDQFNFKNCVDILLNNLK